MFSRDSLESIRASDQPATLHGVVFDILVGSENASGLRLSLDGLPSRSSPAEQPAFAGGISPSSLSLCSSYAGHHASPFWLRLTAPRVARRAKRGGPGRT